MRQENKTFYKHQRIVFMSVYKSCTNMFKMHLQQEVMSHKSVYVYLQGVVQVMVNPSPEDGWWLQFPKWRCVQRAV